VRLADVWRERFTFFDFVARAGSAASGSGAFGGGSEFSRLRVAPLSLDEFSIYLIAKVVGKEIIPKISGIRGVDIGFAELEGRFV